MRRKITVEDLPARSSNFLAINLPHVVDSPTDAQLRVPLGFKIDAQLKDRMSNVAYVPATA